MSRAEPAPPDPARDACLALSLFLTAPAQLGGLSLRGSGPAREALLEMLRDTGVAVRRMPAHVDDERLLGGVDLAVSLASGRTVRARGLLEEIAGGVLVVPLAERLDHAIAGRLAQALDSDARFGLVLLDDGIENEGPPAALLERIAFHCDLTRAGRVEGALRIADPADVAPLDEEALHALAATAAALGVDSVRALNFAGATARAHAALEGRAVASEDDIATAARLVLGPRAMQLPEMPEQPEDEPAPPPDDTDAGERDEASDPGDTPLDDVVLDAALAGPGPVDVENDTFTVHNPTALGAEAPMPVLVAALGPVMLQIAGAHADGTVLWMADEKAIGEHIAPKITKSAAEAGRPAPRIVAGIPVCLCANSEIDSAKERANRILAEAETSPNYQRLLDRGEARNVGDLCAAGDEEAILARFKQFADAGVTDLSVRLLPIGDTRDELIASKYRTREVIAELAKAV